jgi:enoyl-[acyl-carrier protein] reductase I
MKEMMKGKRGVIMGLANDYSLAWGICKTLHEAGAEIALTYQSEILKKRIDPLAQIINSDLLIECDVSKEGSVQAAFNQIKKKWGTIDFVLHSLAFSDKEELKGLYLSTSKANFLNSLDISCYSFTEVCRVASEMMNDGGSLLTLTYYGAEKVMPHYNVMGVAKAALEASVRYLAVDLGGRNIRVNAISAGPAKTLAASGIGDFRYILKWNQYNSPLKRNITLDDVGRSGLYLLSDLSSGVTGEIHHVDAGYHVVGMKAVDAPDITVVMKEAS